MLCRAAVYEGGMPPKWNSGCIRLCGKTKLIFAFDEFKIQMFKHWLVFQN